jgi:Endonuclease/Exonuclease/phosphatase family
MDCHKKKPRKTMKPTKQLEPVKLSTLRNLPEAAKGAVGLIAALLLAATLSSTAAPADKSGGQRSFSTMTINLYNGGGTSRVLALDPADPNYLSNVVFTVTGIYYEIVASQPAARLQRTADEIATRLPDIVSVVEGTLIRTQSPGDLMLGGLVPATHVVFDYVQILTNALAARGVHYALASIAYEIDVEMPMFNLQTGLMDDVRWTDREVILVRTDLPRGQLRVSHPRNGNFTNVIQIPSLGLSVARGWCSVDVFSRGQVFRYVCAHLEEETVPQLQALQARELLASLAHTALPVVLAGDFNSDGLHRDGTSAYDLFPAAGFHDTWAELNPANPAGGLTWGHDEFLADPTKLFDRRIDFVFFRGARFVPAVAHVIDLNLSRPEAPLWASDHGVLSVVLQIKGGPAR